MKPSMTMWVCVLGAGLVWAQNPSIIQNTRNTIQAVSNSEAAATNSAMAHTQSAPAHATAPAKSATAPVGSGLSPMTPRPAKTAKPVRVGSIHKEAPAKPPLVEQKTTAPQPGTAATSETASNGPEAEDPTASDKKYNPNNRRDPFLSPIVSHAGGSGCSTGKKCLEIGTISLRGVVHSENGFIAVVSNGLNKAYFLRENDPVFNGYVVKITDDSIVFQETLQDRLGKTFTREVVKKISTPAV